MEAFNTFQELTSYTNAALFTHIKLRMDQLKPVQVTATSFILQNAFISLAQFHPWSFPATLDQCAGREARLST